MVFKELIKKDYILLDGALGTMLQKDGLKAGEFPESLNLSRPEIVKKVHTGYVLAGSDIICANTFGANDIKLGKNYSAEELITAGVKIAKEAANGKALVALDIGPTGQLIDSFGTLKFDDAYTAFKDAAIAGEKAGCDLAFIQTMSDLNEVRAAVLAVKENTDLPVFCCMTFEKSGKTFTGVLPSAFAVTVSGLGVDAIGINCSQGPKNLYKTVKEIIDNTNLPIIVKANAGLPDIEGNYGIDAKEFSKAYKKFFGMGVNIIGGCCGTTPEYIKELKKNAGIFKFEKRKPIKNILKVCSSSMVVIADKPLIVGERLNPTGKRLYQEALLKGDFSYVAKTAIAQEEAGADILDLNVGVLEQNETELMLRTISEVNSVCPLPLQIDSSNPDCLEAALRHYSGKAIVNSVDADDEKLNMVLPLCKKYGAAVIGLTLDKNGIPKTSGERFKLAKKIVDAATAHGIKKEDVIIDPLTLTAAAEQWQAGETLKALSMIKKQLKVNTALGISNISFGLPQRDGINASFLTMALINGLDLSIINPNSEPMKLAFDAFCVLKNIDKNAGKFILKHAEKNKEKALVQNLNYDISYCIKKGLKETNLAVKKLLETKKPLDIINEDLIPALDGVGKLFEKGEVFLPQLIAAAESAKLGFEEINKVLKIDSQNFKGRILLATVKGDIHDIGKNIVKTVLENYGFEVIDLGKNVDAKNVLDAVKKYDIKLLGLSALMTTTVENMKETINMVKKEKPDCVIMAGGAVLTYDYAISIGADFYGKDAVSSARFAQNVFQKGNT